MAVNYDSKGSLGQYTQELIQSLLKSLKPVSGNGDSNTKLLLLWENASPFLNYV